jgi:hypothetical protein
MSIEVKLRWSYAIYLTILRRNNILYYCILSSHEWLDEVDDDSNDATNTRTAINDQ